MENALRPASKNTPRCCPASKVVMARRVRHRSPVRPSGNVQNPAQSLPRPRMKGPTGLHFYRIFTFSASVIALKCVHLSTLETAEGSAAVSQSIAVRCVDGSVLAFRLRL
jgi:hypothetical protein